MARRRGAAVEPLGHRRRRPLLRPRAARASGRDWLFAPDRIYTDYHEMAAKEGSRPDGIEAVAVCTPNHTHRAVTEAFLRAGIDVICDKPMATTVADAEAMLALQRETGLVLAVTYAFVFHAMVRVARDLVAAGEIGEVRQAHAEFVQDWAIEPANPAFRGAIWRREPDKAGRASATGDIGTHAFHLIEFVTGKKITDVRAEFHVCGAPKAMEDTAFMTIRLDGGVPGTLWVTQAAAGHYAGLRFRIYGTKGGIEWDQEQPEDLRFCRLNAPEQTIVRGHGAGVTPAAERMVHLPRGHGEALSNAWGNLYAELAMAVEARRSGTALPAGLLQLTDGPTAARGVRFVDAAADSNDAGGAWMPVDRPKGRDDGSHAEAADRRRHAGDEGQAPDHHALCRHRRRGGGRCCRRHRHAVDHPAGLDARDARGRRRLLRPGRACSTASSAPTRTISGRARAPCSSAATASTAPPASTPSRGSRPRACRWSAMSG